MGTTNKTLLNRLMNQLTGIEESAEGKPKDLAQTAKSDLKTLYRNLKVEIPEEHKDDQDQ